MGLKGQNQLCEGGAPGQLDKRWNVAPQRKGAPRGACEEKGHPVGGGGTGGEGGVGTGRVGLAQAADPERRRLSLQTEELSSCSGCQSGQQLGALLYPTGLCPFPASGPRILARSPRASEVEAQVTQGVCVSALLTPASTQHLTSSCSFTGEERRLGSIRCSTFTSRHSLCKGHVAARPVPGGACTGSRAHSSPLGEGPAGLPGLFWQSPGHWN